MLSEGNKSGDSSLRDWFGKSKSSDGTPGWVQLGGKYAGKPCAKQPGQTTKPKCGSSKMKRDLNKDEEDAAFRRKNAEDPNPNKKGNAKNVATEETILERGDYWNPDPDKDRKLGGPGANQRAREDGASTSPKPKENPKKLRPGESYMEWSKRQKSKNVSTEGKEELRYCPKCKKAETRSDCAYGTSYWDDNAKSITMEEGKKDACYHKVKSRYKVWPSAYASGALVKCRKKGADNWGNSTKKEEFSPAQITALEINGFVELDEAGKKCWKGYKKAGTQKLFGKTYNRCVKEGSFTIDPKEHNKEKRAAKIGNLARNTSDPGEKAAAENKRKGPRLYGENTTIEDANGNTFIEVIDVIKPDPLVSKVNEAVRLPAKTGNIVAVSFGWRGRYYRIRIFFPYTKVPNKAEVQNEINKVYPGARVYNFMVSDYEPGQPLLQVTEGAAWTKKSGKSESGGLNEKGRKSYEKENPGSDLKAPSKKKGNKRRASFCARMKGMKKKLTSAKTARDPDSRINKSLRAWSCN